jgi:hypothetical protein
MDRAPVQIGQFILGKNLGIGAFGKVRIRLFFWLDTTALLETRIHSFIHSLILTVGKIGNTCCNGSYSGGQDFKQGQN